MNSPFMQQHGGFIIFCVVMGLLAAVGLIAAHYEGKERRRRRERPDDD